MCMADDADRCTVLHNRQMKARKSHKCKECHRTIRAGETYTVERLISDGFASTHKTCAHCMVAREWLGDECGGWIYGGVEEDYREHATSGHYPMSVIRLAVGMDHQWITRKGALMPIPQCPPTTP
jgi:hypothetical protein